MQAKAKLEVKSGVKAHTLSNNAGTNIPMVWMTFRTVNTLTPEAMSLSAVTPARMDTISSHCNKSAATTANQSCPRTGRIVLP
mmetsp:Transcript_20099/g.27705  ORF Transcript_20099/g.27705 Transcript_20099/m.27705 type:complete len:83 (-) Transcript_20099:795-1043(-)